MAFKRLFTLLIVLFLSFSAIFAVGTDQGFMEFGTQHFKIVYEPDSWKTAQFIANGCEDEYDFLCSLFGVDPNMVIPVVVTSRSKVLNAYYTSYPSNRIVLYDAIGANDSLSVFPETTLYVFRHELAHAFTMNIRSPFWQGVSTVFGDGVSVSPALYAYESLVEGVAVLSESIDGFGRLNDLRSTKIVRQAKLEGRFPSWLDIAGAMDVYPSSLLPYLFGGMFLSYLCDEYGVDSVYSIFERFGHVNWFRSTASVIGDSLGVSFDCLWSGFYDSIDVPSSFLQCSFVDSFSQKGSFQSIALAPNGDVLVLDRASSAVYGLSSKGGAQGNGEALGSFTLDECRRLVSVSTYGQELSVSGGAATSGSRKVDDDFLVMVPYLSENSSIVNVFDGNGRFVRKYAFDDRDVRGGCFVEYTFESIQDAESMDFVLLYTSKGQETFLELCMSNGDVVDVIPLGSGAIASGFSSLSDGRVAFVLTRNGVDHFALLDVAEMMLSTSPAPDSMRIASMSCGVDEEGMDVVSFCWFPASLSENIGNMDNVPVLGGYGEFYPDDWSIGLSYANVLGGIGNPLRLGDEVLFSAALYDGDRLCRISLHDLGLEARPLDEPVVEVSGTAATNVSTSNASSPSSSRQSADANDGSLVDSSFIELSKPYHAISNVWRGSLLPFGVYGPLSNPSGLGLGLTWYATDPTDSIALTASGVASGFGQSLWFDFSWKGLVDVGVGARTVIDCAAGTVDAYVLSSYAGLDLECQLGNERSLSLKDSLYASWLFAADGERLFSLTNSLRVAYSYAIGTGLGKTDVLGYSFGLGLQGLDPRATCVLALPRLLPVSCSGSLLYNVPFRMELSAAYLHSYDCIYVSGSAKATVLSYEVQGSVPFLGLYFRRMVLDAVYNAGYLVQTGTFGHSLEIQAFADFSPVLGLYATRLNLNLGARLSFDLEGGFEASLLFSLK